MSDLPQSAIQAARQVAATPKPTTILIALPNMLQENTELTRRLFEYASKNNFRININWITELHFQDYARNRAVQCLIESDTEWLLFIDSDVGPHPKLLELARRGKPICSGLVHCFTKGQLIPSIWIRANCEQCENVKDFLEGKPLRDTVQYMVDRDILFRWNPFRSDWEVFRDRKGSQYPPCRCDGTGKDPWVYKVHPGVFNPQVPFFQCDSVGAAALMVHRSVFQKLQSPWFKFLFRPNREILLTEDHYFCWKAKEAGYEIWADNQMPSSHYKLMDLLKINELMVKAYEKGREDEREELTKSGIVVPEVIPQLTIR